MSCSSSSTLPTTQAPGVISCIRLSVRRKVLLPHPEGPISAWTRLAASDIDTFLTAVNLPYIALRLSVRTCGVTSLTPCEALAGCQSRREAECEHHQDQHQRRRPRQSVPLRIRALGILEHQQR